ncbi:MAG: ferrochelatase [Alphaproteobacteria bacterium]
MKIAVVLFNLGGPDSLDAVEPFLRNLFSDPKILRLPWLIRAPLATWIARRRVKTARGIYASIGGASPLLPNTEAQAKALEAALGDLGEVKSFIAMRYWHPRAEETARRVAEFSPDEIILLPLYPQFSTTTTASSYAEWRREAKRAGLTARTRMICCYPEEAGFIETMAASIRAAYAEASAHGRPRLLFSAHGLPEKIIRAGDPYQAQCERTAAALVRALAIPGLDWVSCYQSRVGPLKWIGPATEAEIARAGRDKVPVIVAPVAFVSEHVETLVELDIEYRHLAMQGGAPFYARVPAVSTAPRFIAGLDGLVRAALAGDKTVCGPEGKRICAREFCGCPQ